MKLVVTSDVISEVGDATGCVCNYIEDIFAQRFGEISYGIEVDMFSLVIVSVYEDRDSNEKVASQYDGAANYKDRKTGRMIKSYGVGVPISPSLLLGLSGEKATKVIANEIAAKLIGETNFPKNFDYLAFKNDLRATLAV